MALSKEPNMSHWYFCTKICLSPTQWRYDGAPRPCPSPFQTQFLKLLEATDHICPFFFIFYGHYRCVLRVFAWAGNSGTI